MPGCGPVSVGALWGFWGARTPWHPLGHHLLVRTAQEHRAIQRRGSVQLLLLAKIRAAKNGLKLEKPFSKC